MTEITTVRLEDIHRRPNARPLDAKLVGQITESVRLVGFMPSKAIDVRKDGDIYWIIDGGHRHAAAKAAGLEEVPVVVEVLDASGVLLVEGAANLQRPDTEEERWARAQEFFTLDVETSSRQIALATGIDAEAQAKARKVLRKLADPVAAEDLTLDQAIAAHEFIDDDAVFDEIMNAGANWQRVYGDAEYRRKNEAVRKAAEAVIVEAGCTLIEEAEPGSMLYLQQTHSESGLVPDGAQYASVKVYGHHAYISWYRDRDDAAEAEANATDEAERKAEDEARAQRQADKARRIEFVRDELASDDLLPGLVEFAHDQWSRGRTADADELAGSPLADVKSFLLRVVAAILSSVNSDVVWLGNNTHAIEYNEEEATDAAEYLELLQASGYELSDGEKSLYERLVSAGARPDDADGEE